MIRRVLLVVIGAWLLALPTHAALYDLRITADSIALDPPYPIAKQTVRVYATVENIGERDTEGAIEFFDGDRKIGSKVLSVRAGGKPDEVWIPWTPESEGGHLLKVRLVSDPDTPDENPSNGFVTLEVYSDRDTDGDGFGDRRDQDDDNDGVTDNLDQFPLDPRRQKDTDNDGIDDKDDQDRDNDGLSNDEEARLGTDPLKRDTDGDGVGDKEDEFPLDRSKSKKDIPKPTPPPPTANTQKTPTPSTPPTSPAKAVTTNTQSPSPAAPLSAPGTIDTDLEIQPVTPSVLEQLGATTSAPTTPSLPKEEGGGVKKESETVAFEAEKNQESSKTIPILIALAVISAGAGGWFLFKSRSA